MGKKVKSAGGSKFMQVWLPVAIVVVITTAVVGTYAGWWNIFAVLGPYTLIHWLGWVGGGYLVVAVPLYSILKRRYHIRNAAMFNWHAFANLLAFGLISVHFAHQIDRPLGSGSGIGSGLAMYLIIAAIVTTGLIQRFGWMPGTVSKLRYIHIGLAISTIFVLPVHVLHNLGVI